MRGFASGLFALLAALLLPVAITTVWTAERVTDTDGYVAAVGPLADDEDVQEALTTRLEDYTADAVGLDQLGGAAEEAARTAIRSTVRAVVTNESFRPVWEAANEAGHAELLRTLSNDQDGQIAPLDITVIFDSVLDALRAQGVPVQEVETPRLVFQPDHRQLRAAQETYQALEAGRTWLPIAWVVLVVISLVVARRRLRALAVLAGASLLTTALLWPLLAALRSGAMSSVPQPDRDLAGSVWDAVTNSLDRATLIALIVSLIVLIAAVAMSAVGNRRNDASVVE